MPGSSSWSKASRCAAPLMHRKIGPTPWPVVGEIRPAFQSAMRASGSRSQPRVPSEPCVLIAIMPLSASVKKRFFSSDTGPTATVRVMSVVPLTYCAPESIRKSSPESMSGRSRRHPVVHDRRMLAGARNRVEGDILQRVLHPLADARRASSSAGSHRSRSPCPVAGGRTRRGTRRRRLRLHVRDGRAVEFDGVLDRARDLAGSLPSTTEPP